MKNDVKICVNMRSEFFEKYYTVPAEINCEVQDFINEITALGEQSESSVEFEQQFAARGLSEKFNGLLTKCTPKAVKMTSEQKAQCRRTLKKMLNENKGEILQDVTQNVVASLKTEAEVALHSKMRKDMIEDETFDDYARQTNKIKDAGRLADFIFKKFKK